MEPLLLARFVAIFIGVLLLLLIRAAEGAPAVTPPTRDRLLSVLRVLLFTQALALVFLLLAEGDPDVRAVVEYSLQFDLVGLGGLAGLGGARLLQRRLDLSFFVAQAAEFMALIGGIFLGGFVNSIVAHLLIGGILWWDQGLASIFVDIELMILALVGLLLASVRVLYNLRLYTVEQQQHAREAEVVRLREQTTRAQLQSLQARINPHFLYNALNAVAGLVHAAPERAERMTLALARLFRAALATDPSPLSTVAQEIQLVETYLEIEHARFGERLRHRIDVDSAARDVPVPRFLLQPLVENAVRHGIAPTTAPGRVEVEVRLEASGALVIAVRDSGPAFPTALTGGYGLQSVQDSLALLYPDRHQLAFCNAPVKEVRLTLFEAVRPAALAQMEAA